MHDESDDRPGRQRTETGVLSTWGDDRETAVDEPARTVLGRYENLELVGHGGMGSVFKAWDPRLNRTVAVKVLGKHGPRARRRFLREARSQAQLSHPNVCEIYEVGELEDTPYIAMRFISGRSLAAVHTELGIGEKIRVLRDVARAIHAAHEKGLIHRDIKPSNIMVERAQDGRYNALVVDFGLSRYFDDQADIDGIDRSSTPAEVHEKPTDLTYEGEVSGTPAYMAPEQALGLVDRLDARTDVYSLGCSMYEVLGGRPPLVADSAMSLLLMATTQMPPRLRTLNSAVPVDLEAIVTRCLEKDPDDRYPTAEALAEDLDLFLQHRPVAAHGGGLAYAAGRFIHRQPLLFTVLLMLLVVGTVASVSWARQRWEVRRQAEVAQRFGYEVARLEGFLWKVRSLPPHDTTESARTVRERMVHLEKWMKDAGGAAEGPGNFALGSVQLALGELEGARRHLESAWDRGYRGPEVAYALGVTFSRLFQQGLDRLQTIGEAEIRQSERLRLERDLRDRARQFLGLTAGAPLEAPEIVTGLIALCERRYGEAIDSAVQCFASKPWIYEAKLLEGDAFAARAFESDGPPVGKDFSAARAAYLVAADLAPSDPRCHVRLAGLQLRLLGFANEIEHRVFREEELKQAVEHSEQAILVDPSLLAARVMLADIYTAAAVNGRSFELGDPVDAFERALAAVNEAVRLSPDDAIALGAAGKVGTLKAVDAMRWGGVEDETIEGLLEGAMTSLSRAIELQPTYNNYNLLGVASRRRGIWRGMRGMECSKDFETASSNLRSAIERFPEAVHALHNLASVLHAQAYFAAPELEERADILEQSIQAYLQLLERHPSDPEVHYSMGQAEADLASVRQEQGQNPVHLYDRSIASFERAVELFPGFFQAQRAAGYGLVLKAGYVLDHGSDPSLSLDRARELLDAACEHQGFASPWVTLGAVHRVQAEYEYLTGHDPGPELDASVAAYDTSLEIRSGRPDVFVERARTMLLQARYDLDAQIDPTSFLEGARKGLEKAIDFNPSQWQAEGLRAESYVLQARWDLRQDVPVETLLVEASDALDAEAANNPSDRLHVAITAELALCRAQQVAKVGHAPGPAVEGGLAALTEALAADPLWAQGYILAGMLHAFNAEQGGDGASEQALLASKSFSRGIELNPFLARRYGEDLIRAQALMQP